jgi:phosphoribosyl-dephospho-CoA transferase
MSSNRELDDYIGFDISSDLKRKAREAARRDGRKLSNYMRHVLSLTLAAEGELEDEDGRREAVPT